MDEFILFLNNGYNPFTGRSINNRGLGYKPPRGKIYGSGPKTAMSTDIVVLPVVVDEDEESDEEDEEDEEEEVDGNAEDPEEIIENATYYDINDVISLILEFVNKPENHLDEEYKRRLIEQLTNKELMVREEAEKRIIPTTLEINQLRLDIDSYIKDIDNLEKEIKEENKEYNEFQSVEIPKTNKVPPKYLNEFYNRMVAKKLKASDFIQDDFYNLEKIKEIRGEQINKDLPKKVTSEKFLGGIQEYLIGLVETGKRDENPSSPQKVLEDIDKAKLSIRKQIQEKTTKKDKDMLTNASNKNKVKEFDNLQKKLGIKLGTVDDTYEEMANLQKIISRLDTSRKGLVVEINEIVKGIEEYKIKGGLKPFEARELHELERDRARLEKQINDNIQRKKGLLGVIEKENEEYIYQSKDRTLTEKEIKDLRGLLKEGSGETIAYQDFVDNFIDKQDEDIVDEVENRKLKYIFSEVGFEAIRGFYREDETEYFSPDYLLPADQITDKVYRGKGAAYNNFERILAQNDLDDNLTEDNRKIMRENRKEIMKQLTGKTDGIIYLAEDYLSYSTPTTKDADARTIMPSAGSFAFDAVRNPEGGDDNIGEIFEIKKYTDTVHTYTNLIDKSELVSSLSLQIFKKDIMVDMKLIKDLNEEYENEKELGGDGVKIQRDIVFKKASLKNKIVSLNSILKEMENKETNSLDYLLEKKKINESFSNQFNEPIGIEIGINKFGNQPIYLSTVSPNSIKDASQLLKNQGTDYDVLYDNNGRVKNITSSVEKNKSKISESIEHLYKFDEKNNTYDLIFVVGVKDTVLKFNYSEHLRKLKAEADAKNLPTIDTDGNLIYSGYNIFRITPDFYSKDKTKSLLIPIHLWKPLKMSELADLTFLPSTKAEKKKEEI